MNIQISALNFNYQAKKSFKGTPQRIYGDVIHDYHDAIRFWENLRFAKYLDAHDNSYYDKSIRADNYSFLDKLTSYFDKAGFVENFCNFTGFPKLSVISNKINTTFKTCINNIANELNYYEYSSPYNIVDAGYDPTCSLALNMAFPGSDLDKGYVIIKGSSGKSNTEDVSLINKFKGKLWEDLDQRIVSLNHANTEVSVYTKNQIKNMLDYLDEKGDKVITERYKKAAIAGAWGTLCGTFLGPAAIFFGGIAAANSYKKNIPDPDTTDPYEAAIFNRQLAKRIDSKTKKTEAKNFAFFIETVAANLRRNSDGKYDEIFSRIRNSDFVENSNVTQIEAWQKKLNNGYRKSKLKNRERLQSDFYYMDTETKYDLIKDIIKYGTDEQSSRFIHFFKNDDDIAHRYDKLLKSLE